MLRGASAFTLAVLAVGVAGAQTPTESYNSLFGDEARRVAATRDAKDDARFAVKLLEGARSVSAEPQFQTLQGVLRAISGRA